MTSQLSHTLTRYYHIQSMDTTCDYAWVSDELIATLDGVYANDIQRTNASYDEEYGEVDEVYGWDTASTFREILYLDYKFVTGEMYGTCFHGGPLIHEHKKSVQSDLQYLVKHGVCTHNGQEPLSDCGSGRTGRSYLDFIVMVRDDIVPEFIDVLKQLYQLGVNVDAFIVKGTTTIQKVLFAKEGDFTIVTEDFHENTVDFPVGFKKFHKHLKYKVTLAEKWDFKFNDVLNQKVLQDKQDTHSRFHCEIWRNVFDNKKVEEIFIPLWKEFNTKFGALNDS